MRRRAVGWVEERTLITSDGVAISVAYRPRLGGPVEPADTRVFVVAHGFSGSLSVPTVERVAATLAERGAVVGLDFRGHGHSQGRSTLGGAEIYDLDAAVRWARLLGHDPVTTVGFSMGAAIAVRHAALLGGVDSVVSVSGPSRWYYRGTPPMRRLHTLVERRPGRVFARVVMGTRVVDQVSEPLPEEPRAVAGRIAPVPLLVVHGEQDAFFPVEHARQIAEAHGSADLWVVPGFGHAEASIDEALTRRIAQWASSQVLVR